MLKLKTFCLALIAHIYMKNNQQPLLKNTLDFCTRMSELFHYFHHHEVTQPNAQIFDDLIILAYFMSNLNFDQNTFYT
jgi:hypothetical protein